MTIMDASRLLLRRCASHKAQQHNPQTSALFLVFCIHLQIITQKCFVMSEEKLEDKFYSQKLPGVVDL